jgi:ABC-2 type transport system ATP-binding protein
VVLVGVASPARAAEALGSADFINKLETHEDSVRLYVDEGASAIPLILRALDSAAVPLGTIELHRPSLDDVFLTKTGRSLRES